MRISLFDPYIASKDLLPLTFTRPCSEIRVGIDSIREKWEYYFGSIGSWHTSEHLKKKYPLRKEGASVFLNSCLIPDPEITEAIKSLKEGEGIKKGEQILSYHGSADIDLTVEDPQVDGKFMEWTKEVKIVNNLWDIFSLNADEIASDIRLKKLIPSTPTDPHTIIYGKENVFCHESAEVRAAILNAENGPIHIDEGAVINEGSILYGPLSIGSRSVISPGAKIRGGTTIGPNSKVGGEVNNSVLFGFSNKAHDGFLGNSVIGEWCNLGADTNNSNLKNNYDEVKLWNFRLKRFQKTGKQFCGLIMGDHSKCSINTMFNTGTVVGVGANIFGSGFHSNLIPSFSWGGPQGRTTFQLKRFFQTSEIAMKRRGQELSENDKEIFQWVFENTSENRAWENK